jgi:hypothetical protein
MYKFMDAEILLASSFIVFYFPQHMMEALSESVPMFLGGTFQFTGLALVFILAPQPRRQANKISISKTAFFISPRRRP